MRKQTPLTHVCAMPPLQQGLKLADHKPKSRKSLREAFVTALAHELRTPLAVALGYSEMLHKQMLGPLNQDQENALTTILRNSKTLCAAVNDVISILEIEAGSIVYEPQIFDPLSLLEELKTSFAAPRGKGLRLQWDIPAALPLMQTDRSELSKILSRLIDYAISFTDKEAVIVTAQSKGIHEIEFNVAESMEGNCDEKVGNGSPRCHRLELLGLRQPDSRMFGLYVIKSLTAMLGGTLETRNGLDYGPSVAVSFPTGFSRSAKSRKLRGDKK